MTNSSEVPIQPTVLVVSDIPVPSETATEAVTWLLGTVVEYLVDNRRTLLAGKGSARGKFKCNF